MCNDHKVLIFSCIYRYQYVYSDPYRRDCTWYKEENNCLRNLQNELKGKVICLTNL